jgi:hypothetical protein
MSAESRRAVQSEIPVSEFLGWHAEKRLKLNPRFQRRSVWTPDAKSYLIDTILQGFPMPRIYMRTEIDLKTRVTFRDVVDGQQRLRAIIEFAEDRFALSHRSGDLKGKRFSDLDEELQRRFLSYPIGVDLLLNASDTLVLQIFGRLNSYNVPLNAAEKRHAQYETELRWFVYDLSNELRWFLERYTIVTTRAMLRMEDDVFFAELVNVLMTGIGDGGAGALDRLYKDNQGALPSADEMANVIRDWVAWIDSELAELLGTVTLSRTYQLHMLFAAYAHQVEGIPRGRLEQLPPRSGIGPTEEVVERLGALIQAVELDVEGGPHREFVEASSGATTRFNTRSKRFLAYSNAIAAR